MPTPDRNPLHELVKYVIVAAVMCFVMLVLTRGKWFVALLVGVWLFFAIRRLARSYRK